MNKVLFIASILFAIWSCKQKNQQTTSLYTNTTSDTTIQDSLSDQNTEKLAEIAWGDACFGITQKEAIKTQAFEKADSYGNFISKQSELYELLGLKCFIKDFNAFFEMDELVSIQIKTHLVDADYIDALEYDVNKISKEFSKKYGDPSYSIGRSISINDFNEGDEFFYERWNIGSKYIHIYFGESSSGNEYYYKISIGNTSYPTKSDTKEKERTKEEIQRKQEIKKYQF